MGQSPLTRGLDPLRAQPQTPYSTCFRAQHSQSFTFFIYERIPDYYTRSGCWAFVLRRETVYSFTLLTLNFLSLFMPSTSRSISLISRLPSAMSQRGCQQTSCLSINLKLNSCSLVLLNSFLKFLILLLLMPSNVTITPRNSASWRYFWLIIHFLRTYLIRV